MGQFLLLLVVALTVAAVVFGVTVLVTGNDPGLAPVEPDGRAVPLPGSRPLAESDVTRVRFDTVVRGYRMAQVDQAMRRAAYDIGYKDELIGVLEAEVNALREGRDADADALRRARLAAVAPAAGAADDAPAAASGDAPAAASGDAPAAASGDAPAAASGAKAEAPDSVAGSATDAGGTDVGGTDVGGTDAPAVAPGATTAAPSRDPLSPERA